MISWLKDWNKVFIKIETTKYFQIFQDSKNMDAWILTLSVTFALFGNIASLPERKYFNSLLYLNPQRLWSVKI